MTRSPSQKSTLTGSSSAGRRWAPRRSPPFYIEGTHSHKVMHSLHLEKQQSGKLWPGILNITCCSHSFMHCEGKLLSCRQHGRGQCINTVCVHVQLHVCSLCIFMTCDISGLHAAGVPQRSHMTYCCKPFDGVRRVLGLGNLDWAKDAFEAVWCAPFHCKQCHWLVILWLYSGPTRMK